MINSNKVKIVQCTCCVFVLVCDILPVGILFSVCVCHCTVEFDKSSKKKIKQMQPMQVKAQSDD